MTKTSTSQPYLIDSHCHLHDQEWFTPEQAEELIQSARAAGIRKIITIGTDPEDSLNAQSFAAAHDGIYWTYGIHPEYAAAFWRDHPDGIIPFPPTQEIATSVKANAAVQEIAASVRANNGVCDSANSSCEGPKTWASAPERPEQETIHALPCAIGEIGLDYHYEDYDRDQQIRLFERCLQLARDHDLPVTLHIRGAFDDALPILDNFPGLRGVVHSFTGSKKVLRQVLARDFYVGVNGLITYSTLPLPPLEKMLLETDAPFLTPVPFRGTMNTPGYTRLVAQYLSGKLDIPEELIAERTTNNVQELFHI